MIYKWTTDALVIGGMKSNWSRHYLRRQGYSDAGIQAVFGQCERDGLITGNIKYLSYMLFVSRF